MRFAYARKITIPKCKLPFMKTELFGSQKKDHDVLFSATKIRISEKCKLEFNVTHLALSNKSSYIMFRTRKRQRGVKICSDISAFCKTTVNENLTSYDIYAYWYLVIIIVHPHSACLVDKQTGTIRHNIILGKCSSVN